jgi:hypothetical protein
MTNLLCFAIGALTGAGLVYGFYRKLQSELTQLKQAARAKVGSAL